MKILLQAWRESLIHLSAVAIQGSLSTRFSVVDLQRRTDGGAAGRNARSGVEEAGNWGRLMLWPRPLQRGTSEMSRDEETSPSSSAVELRRDVAEKCCESFHRGRSTLAVVTQLDWRMNVDTRAEDVGAFLQRHGQWGSPGLTPTPQQQWCVYIPANIFILISCSYLFSCHHFLVDPTRSVAATLSLFEGNYCTADDYEPLICGDVLCKPEITQRRRILCCAITYNNKPKSDFLSISLYEQTNNFEVCLHCPTCTYMKDIG